MRKLIWTVLHGLVLLALWAGVYKELDWALNIFNFVIWIDILGSIVGYCNDDLCLSLRKKGHSVHRYIYIPYNIMMGLLIASFGWFITAFFYFIAVCCEYSIYATDSLRSDEDK